MNDNDTSRPAVRRPNQARAKPHKAAKKAWNKELARLQVELVKLQESVRSSGQKVVVLFEGRDAAGKGGVIKRITETLNPRFCRVVALGTPDRARADPVVLPALRRPPARGRRDRPVRPQLVQPGRRRAGHGLLHRRGVRGVPPLVPGVRAHDRPLRASILIKYWFSVSDEEQERRFQARIANPTKRWKLSPMDLESARAGSTTHRPRTRCSATPTSSRSPWWVVQADNKDGPGSTASTTC